MNPSPAPRFWTLRLAVLATLIVFGPWHASDTSALAQTAAQEDDPNNDDELVVRPDPPALDDFETDKNKDGVPDGWYNLRDAKVITEGGVVGPRYLKFECARPGRPARLSRAFGVDSRKYGAIVIGLWVRLDQIQTGERLGEEPGLIIDFLGDKLRQLTRGSLGPWTMRTFGAAPHWTHVSKRIAVPAGAKDAIMSLGLLGATGVLEVDGLTIKLIPVGGTETTNLLKNGDFELGDPNPTGWTVENGARRTFPGFRSTSALELAASSARANSGLALPLGTISALEITLNVKGQGLRGSGGAGAQMFFLDENGHVLPRLETGVVLFLWSDSFDWRDEQKVIEVPEGSARAVLQFQKLDGIGSVRIDDVVVTASPNPEVGAWTPYHVAEDTDGWLAVSPSTGIEARSALDFSFLLDNPAGRRGGVTIREGRFHFGKSGPRARFFGVQLLPPTAFLEPASAEALADRLARSGVNLVRFGDLDTPVGPSRSLFDDTRDDTKAFDPVALERLDHLIACLKSRGMSYAMELQGARRFREDDGVRMPGALPPGGGPAALFDPKIKRLSEEAVRALLSHVNPETKLAYKDDPALAWVTLAGEQTLFDLIENPSVLPSDYARELKELAARSTLGAGRRFWQSIESAHWKDLSDLLRKDRLKAPVAGVSHWRRGPKEFDEVQVGPGLDLIDDRIYFAAPQWIAPRWRSMLWSLEGGMITEASRKRKLDRPYVVGQWCDYTQGIWAYPHEAAEQLLASAIAVSEDWDAIVRRGIFLYPESWGNSAPGTAGLEDIFQIPEVANAAPQVFALWPHAASLMLRGHDLAREKEKEKDKEKEKARARDRNTSRGRRHGVPGWEPDRGRLVVDSAYTEGVAGWPGGEVVSLEHLGFDIENPYAVVVASSAGPETLAKSRRLLVTAIAKVEPTGFRYVDEWRKETADPGRPPLLQEPVKGKVIWKRKGTIKAYALDNNGNRIGPVKVAMTNEGTLLVLDGTIPSLHFEMIVE